MINALLVATGFVFCQAAGAAPIAQPPAGKGPLTPEQQHQQDLADDVAKGKRYSADVERQIKVSKNAEYQARVQRIGAQIADVANHNRLKALWGDTRFNTFEYHYKVLEGKDVNAFSLPGGYIYVYEGLLDFVESDDELAGVLGHETSHAAFRHVATLQKRESKLEAFQIPLIIASILAHSPVPFLGGSLTGAAVTNGWSRQAEQAADYGGFQILMKSHYNPVGMLTFMERLQAEEHKGVQIDWGIYRDHPPTRERADDLMAWITAAGVPIKRSLVTTTFRTTLKPGDKGLVEAWFAGRVLYAFSGPDARSRAEQAATKIDAFMDRVPELFEVTSGDDGTVYGDGKALFQVTQADADAAGFKLPDAIQRAETSVKRSLAVLGYRVWDVH